MDASSLAQTAALLGIEIPAERTAAIAADMAELAERLNRLSAPRADAPPERIAEASA